MYLARTTLKKIEKCNLVDFYDVEKIYGKSKLTSFSNFSLTNKQEIPT